jgi:mRNA interferase MazF
VTSQVKGYPFEVLLPAGLAASGAILSDQVKSLDSAPEGVVEEVLGKILTLIRKE